MKNVVTRVTRCKMDQFLTRSWNFTLLLVAYTLGTCWLLVRALLKLFHATSQEVPN